MLGQPMCVQVSESLKIRLAPFTKDEVQHFIKDGGMQLHSVSRYLNSRQAFTAEDEQEWYERVRARNDGWTWGIWDDSGDQPILIGNTALFGLDQFPLRQATSGSGIVNKDYWGRGIASATHKARTWYAFNQLNLVRIKSAVALPNVGSKKALLKSGYFYHSTERNVQFTDGAYVHQENFECLNPSDQAWSLWWGSDTPPKEAVAARAITLEALAWADKHVTLL